MDSKFLVLGGGCFWCIEAMYKEIPGVTEVKSGYAGGELAHPTYKQVCSGTTGHAEVIRVEFDPSLISREDLIRIFFSAHDPTTLNRQGGDIGPQYRSVIFVASDEERELAKQIIEEVNAQGLWPAPIVTSLEPLNEFYIAEDEHQNYFSRFESSSMWDKLNYNAPYCSNVVAPKVAKFRKEIVARLRAEAAIKAASS